MSMTLVMQCDSCREEIKKGDTYYHFRLLVKGQGMRNQKGSQDLCFKCFKMGVKVKG
jgi:hypothetical protein